MASSEFQVVARAGDIAPGTCKIVSVQGREIGIFNLEIGRAHV